MSITELRDTAVSYLRDVTRAFLDLIKPLADVGPVNRDLFEEYFEILEITLCDLFDRIGFLDEDFEIPWWQNNLDGQFERYFTEGTLFYNVPPQTMQRLHPLRDETIHKISTIIQNYIDDTYLE